MSTQPRLKPTRRTVLRTAAWTAPAISIAVAAPAFAASGKIGKASGTLTRDGFKKLTFNVSFSNTGVLSYAVVVVVTYKNGSQVITGGTVAAGGVAAIPTAVNVQSNDDDQTVTLQYYADSVAAANLLGTLTFTDVDKSATRTGVWA